MIFSSAAASRCSHFLASTMDWKDMGTGRPRAAESSGVKKGKVMSHPVDITRRSQGRDPPFWRRIDESTSFDIDVRCTLAHEIVSQKPGVLETPTLSELQNIL